MQRNVWIIAISVVAALILINNTIYYFLTKKTLEDELKHEMLTLAKQIELSVEQSRNGAEQFEAQIGRELRAAAIAAQYALDPDVEKVTNEQLVELSAKLGIDHITLLKRTEDDIVLYRSSDPSQLNKSTKNWVPWHKIFNQMLDDKVITETWLGQKMPYFWSGPFEVSSTETGMIYKWGYYYDGTTNYIIDPYIRFDAQEEYNRITGVDRLINDLVANVETLIEITAMNPRTFPHGNWSEDEQGEAKEHIVQRPQIFGDYTVKTSSDIELVQQAYQTRQVQSMDERVDGRDIYKLFIPVSVDGKGFSITDEKGNQLDAYVLSVVSDYGFIKQKLAGQFLNLGIIIILLTAASLIIALISMRYYKISRDKAVQVTQETYTEEINSLFHSIKAQRHDFLNHVQTIHSLAELRKQDELVAYTKELTGEIRLMNDIINIGNPAIAALIRSKISQAESYRIQFHCRFNGLNLQGMGGKTLDMNRILGNLIDNAFDEVMKYDEARRHVHLVGNQTENKLEIIITNTCDDAEQQPSKPLFNAGYSTKLDQHQGLGLSIVRQIVSRYKGETTVFASSPDQLTFVVKIPL